MTSTLLKKVLKEIRLAAKEADIDPSDMTKTVLLGREVVTEWELRKLGGLTNVLKAHFPQTEKSLGEIHELSQAKSYISKLEKIAGKTQSEKDALKSTIEKLIIPLPKPKAKALKHKKSPQSRHVVAMLNDNHIGAIVDPEEIGNLNSFGLKEAGRRIAYYIMQVADYKIEKRSQVETLHLIFLGDNMAGVIHGLETNGQELLIHQQNAMLHIYTHALHYLADKYANIKVYGIAGNHGRLTFKNHGNRPTNEVYDSYENIMLYALSVAFRQYKNIQFDVPKNPYIDLFLPAGRALAIHGDHIFSKAIGNPGRAINVKGISEAIRKFNAGEVSRGRDPVKLLLLGHTHCFASFITEDGIHVLNAPSLIGVDAFAHSLTINTSIAGQVVFESTQQHILGDNRLIRVEDADTMKELDTIIPEYKYNLKW